MTHSVNTNVQSKYRTVTWVLASGETGDAVGCSRFPEATVQVFGTFGGGNVTLQGSLDGVNWAPLKNTEGAALTISAAAIERVNSNPAFIRPVASVAVGLSLTVMIGATGVI